MSVAIPPATVARLAKLLPMLGSPEPGEVAGTVAAMSRTLKAAGQDWHALAACIKANAAPAFTFATLPPRQARKMLAMLAARKGMAAYDAMRMATLIAQLHRMDPKYRLPAPLAEWLDGLWNGGAP